jgi:homopolymeric O-antigen transport system permease protein
MSTTGTESVRETRDVANGSGVRIGLPQQVPTSQSLLRISVIEPRTGWRMVDWREFLEFRDLYWFLVWRSIKARYAQSALGIGWAVIQPLFSMIVLTVVFGKLARVESDGVPYAVFSFTAVVPWTYFANAVTDGTASLVNNATMISKVYFPRLFLPLGAVVSKLVDFSIASAMLVILLVWYHQVPTVGVLALPMLVVLMAVTAAGIGMWLAALAVQYRDVQYAVTFMIQLAMYASPVVYPATLVPARYQNLYALNPMVGVIEGFRSALLGTRGLPWAFLGIGTVVSLLLFFSGMLYFRRREHVFADVA